MDVANFPWRCDFETLVNTTVGSVFYNHYKKKSLASHIVKPSVSNVYRFVLIIVIHYSGASNVFVCFPPPMVEISLWTNQTKKK